MLRGAALAALVALAPYPASAQQDFLTDFILPEADRGNDAPLGRLFQDGRGFSTAMFWIAFFMCLFMLEFDEYFL